MATTIRAMGWIPCSRRTRNRSRTSRARSWLLAPMAMAVGTSERYVRYPVSSFTSITNALISVRSASRTSSEKRRPPKAHALT